MLDFLIYPISFIAALAILIAVHEFGHFWVARRLGVKVLRFSIGFGKPLWKHQSSRDDTEYVVAAIPLGGYVKMLDEREGEVLENEKHLAFNNKSVWKRFAIVAAGPGFNFIFAILALWFIYMVGVTGTKPLVGDIVPDSRAQHAGIIQNDLIKSIDGKDTPSWSAVRLALLDAALDQKMAEITVVDQHGDEQIRQLHLAGISDPVEDRDLMLTLGMNLWSPKAELGRVIKSGPADEAGMKEGDIVVEADGKEVRTWIEWVIIVRASPDKTLNVKIDRNGQIIPLQLKVARIEDKGKVIGRSQVEFPKKYWDNLTVKLEYGPVQALKAASIRTWDMSMLMLRVLGRIVVGDSSLKNISGPLTIAQFAGSSANNGWKPFLSFLILISVSLGVLNLLPIPVLDGGHLFYYLYEIITRKQVSEQFQATAQQFGIFLLVALMGLAFYNDILRLFGD